MIVDKSKTMIRQKQNREGKGGYTESQTRAVYYYIYARVLRDISRPMISNQGIGRLH
jgi:hypothetical protein